MKPTLPFFAKKLVSLRRVPRSATPYLVIASLLTTSTVSYSCFASKMPSQEYYRSDGVRITHDPYAKGMAEKYGMPGKTDSEGFDPYADSVGPGIYGGIVKRDSSGNVVVGKQYQNHNPRPGPVYAGGGYTPVNAALSNIPTLTALLDKFPDLVNDVSTGGAQPLHMCGMSQKNQHAAAVLVARGADIEAVDTYGFTPLLRMASNNLAAGAQALLLAGADPNNTGLSGSSPLAVAQQSRATSVIDVLKQFKQAPADVQGGQSAGSGSGKGGTAMHMVVVAGCDFKEVNGEYTRSPATTVPEGFASVCQQQGWDVGSTWAKLGQGLDWFRAPNGAYIYFNHADGCWWIDAPDGAGVFKAPGPAHAVPAAGWQLLSSGAGHSPTFPSLQIYRGSHQPANKSCLSPPQQTK